MDEDDKKKIGEEKAQRRKQGTDAITEASRLSKIDETPKMKIDYAEIYRRKKPR
jgi:hypothetical protein